MESKAPPAPAHDKLGEIADDIAFELPCLCGLRREPHQGMCPALSRIAIKRKARAVLEAVVRRAAEVADEKWQSGFPGEAILHEWGLKAR